MKRKIATLCLAIVLFSSNLTGCTIGKTEIVLNMNSVGRNHVFSINGVKCTKEEARLYLCNYQNIYGNAYGINLWDKDYAEMEESANLEDYVKDVTLSELANIMCMGQMAEQQEIVLTEDEKKKASDAAEEYYESLSRYEKSYIGIDRNKLKEIYEKYAIAQKLYNMLTQGINEEVSDDEARVVRIHQIYVKNEEVALQVQKKLASGDKFDALASNYNEANVIEKYLVRGEYPIEVENIVFRLDNDEQSDMIATEKGYYFIKCINKYEEELTEANKEVIVVKRRKEQFDDKFVEFVESSQFDLNERVWKNITVDTSGNIKTKSFFDVYEKYFTK